MAFQADKIGEVNAEIIVQRFPDQSGKQRLAENCAKKIEQILDEVLEKIAECIEAIKDTATIIQEVRSAIHDLSSLKIWIVEHPEIRERYLLINMEIHTEIFGDRSLPSGYNATLQEKYRAAGWDRIRATYRSQSQFSTLERSYLKVEIRKRLSQ